MLVEYRKQMVKYGLVLVVAAIIGAIYVKSQSGAKEGEAKEAGSPVAAISVKGSSDEKVGVHVAGGVHRPGVYWLKGGSRVTDAIQSAGGATERGDLSALNLAAKLEDGRQVLVPIRGSAAQGGGASQPQGGGAGGAGQERSATPSAGGAAPGEGGTKPLLNLNTATQEQLEALDGVGPSTARKILDHRQQKGGFTRVEDLGEIGGIGEKKLASLRAQVTV
jgi:competence protein ComEA